MVSKQIKAALFDLDGVVFNTEDQYTVFWGNQCRQYHPDKPGLEYTIKGQTLVQIFDKYFNGMEEEQAEIVKRLDEFERNMNFEYVKGFVDFVLDLKANGVNTAVVTSSNNMKMNSVYASRAEFKSYFDIILTSEDFERSKPDPECYLKGAKVFNFSPEECIVFEDSFNGLKSGKAAGMRVIGLATTNSKESISPLSDYVVSDFEGLNYQNLCKILSKVI